ncbi:hypothetical protein C8R46DRAFT_303991 [Mycena filopes]|nr:hypothetical protein C8R46DRAFT_303991 [Mycena filopes]
MASLDKRIQDSYKASVPASRPRFRHHLKSFGFKQRLATTPRALSEYRMLGELALHGCLVHHLLHNAPPDLPQEYLRVVKHCVLNKDLHARIVSAAGPRGAADQGVSLIADALVVFVGLLAAEYRDDFDSLLSWFEATFGPPISGITLVCRQYYEEQEARRCERILLAPEPPSPDPAIVFTSIDIVPDTDPVYPPTVLDVLNGLEEDVDCAMGTDDNGVKGSAVSSAPASTFHPEQRVHLQGTTDTAPHTHKTTRSSTPTPPPLRRLAYPPTTALQFSPVYAEPTHTLPRPPTTILSAPGKTIDFRFRHPDSIPLPPVAFVPSSQYRQSTSSRPRTVAGPPKRIHRHSTKLQSSPAHKSVSILVSQQPRLPTICRTPQNLNPGSVSILPPPATSIQHTNFLHMHPPPAGSSPNISTRIYNSSLAPPGPLYRHHYLLPQQAQPPAHKRRRFDDSMFDAPPLPYTKDFDPDYHKKQTQRAPSLNAHYA